MKTKIDIPNETFQEVANSVNDRFGLYFSKEQIKNARLPTTLLVEIMEDTYTDTDQIEQIVDCLALKYIGSRCPCYGEQKDIVDKFYRTAKDKGVL